MVKGSTLYVRQNFSRYALDVEGLFLIPTVDFVLIVERGIENDKKGGSYEVFFYFHLIQRDYPFW